MDKIIDLIIKNNELLCLNQIPKYCNPNYKKHTNKLQN